VLLLPRPFRADPDADHVIPRVRGGIDATENLMMAARWE
jgi:5-methylcytosine-specific restriction endonuclease McrA